MYQFNDASFLSYSINKDCEIIGVSQGWLDLLGYIRDDVIGSKITNFMDHDSRVYAETVVIPSLWKDGYYKNIHYKLLSKSNEVFDVLVHGTFDRDNEQSFEFMIDITDRIKVENELRLYRDDLENLILERTEQLQEITEMYRILSKTSPVGMMRVDDDGNCTYINQSWEDFTGLTKKQAMKRGWLDAVHPKDRKKVEKEWLSSIKKHVAFNLEYRLLTPDESTMWILNQVKPVNGNNGFVATFTDITVKKEVLPQLIELKQYGRSAKS